MACVIALFNVLFILAFLNLCICGSHALPKQILMDTDMDTDDFFAILYLLKQNRSEVNLKAITISANAWTNAGHAVNQLYDLLYMMGRDDIQVGIGGEGGILFDGTILPDVGGYLSLAEQENSTAGGCRYRQAIPPGQGGQMDIDSNYGIRKDFLPQVFHSGLPITLVPLDATNTIPINKDFFLEFEQEQHTYEAQYVFESLKITRDTWFNDEFYTSYFMWDSFTSGILLSSIWHGYNNIEDNDFAELKYRYITIVTSNKPYGIQDGSNTFFDNRTAPKFHLKQRGVHSGHVQTGIRDPFCLVRNGKGKCMDGYTKEVSASEGVRVLVAEKAKPNKDINSTLDREYFISFLHGITITANGWANAATVDIIYDILHMMGRDDIPVGLGEFFALGQAYPTLNSTGDCKYRKAIPHGAGGYIDSDTLFGLARDLPRSPRRYTAHNSVKYGAPRDTEHPELRQPKAQEVLQNVMNGFESGRKVTVLTTGPLTNIATFLSSNTNSSSKIEQLYIVGGHIGQNEASDGGNVFTVLSNRKAEFNMYLDPLAAKQVLASKLNITMIPLKILRKASSFTRLLRELALAKDTPEAIFVHRLLSRMFQLHRSHHAYAHIDMFLGEVVGAAIMADRPQLKLVTQIRSVSVLANSEVGSDGWTIVDHRNGNPINLVEDIDSFAYYSHLSTILNEKNQSAIIASFSAQKKLWSTPPPQIGLPTL